MFIGESAQMYNDQTELIKVEFQWFNADSRTHAQQSYLNRHFHFSKYRQLCCQNFFYTKLAILY